MNLITAQDNHIERILSAKPYRLSNSMGDLTLLRRKLSSLRSSRQQYRKDLEKLGFSKEQINITMQDAEDIAVLEYYAD